MKTKLELRKDIITSLSNESLGEVFGGSYSDCIKSNEIFGCNCTDEDTQGDGTCSAYCGPSGSTDACPTEDCGFPGDPNSDGCGSYGNTGCSGIPGVPSGAC